MRYLALVPLLLAGEAAASSPEFGALEEITFADIGQHGMFGAGCNFSVVGETNTVLFLGMDDRGYLKVDGARVALAPDPAGGELGFGARAAYANGAYRVQVSIEG
jgi:hypothetical protein